MLQEQKYNINGVTYSLIGSNWFDESGNKITDNKFRQKLFSDAIWKNRVPIGTKKIDDSGVKQTSEEVKDIKEEKLIKKDIETINIVERPKIQRDISKVQINKSEQHNKQRGLIRKYLEYKYLINR